MVNAPSGTVTFLFTDIEGSTVLWEHSTETMDRALRTHDRRLREVFDKHRGYVFATTGDGFAVAFGDPLDAVRAAISVQRVIADEDWGPIDVRVRVALDTGMATERDGDFFGPVVNRTARILDQTRGGQIVASSTTADLLRKRLPAEVTERALGRHHLRDVEGRIGLVALDLAPVRTPRRRSDILLLAASVLAAAVLIWAPVERDEPAVPATETTTTPEAPAGRELWTSLDSGFRAHPDVRPVVIGGSIVFVSSSPPAGELVKYSYRSRLCSRR